MRRLSFGAAAATVALAWSAPALATGGFGCRPVSGSGPTLDIVIGHTPSARPLSVTLREGRRTFSTAAGAGGALVLGQSWIDERHLWLDLLDSNANRFEAKLRASFQPRMRGRPAIGTLVRGGRTYRMRCIEG